MVSLINFKSVTEDLQQQQQQHDQPNQIISNNAQTQDLQPTSKEMSATEEYKCTSSNDNRMLIKVNHQHELKSSTQCIGDKQEQEVSLCTQQQKSKNHQLVLINQNDNNVEMPPKQVNLENTHTSTNNQVTSGCFDVNSTLAPTSFTNSTLLTNRSLEVSTINNHHQLYLMKQSQPIGIGTSPDSLLCSSTPASFVVTWRNLKFSIEPKWHQRVVSGVAPAFRRKDSNSDGAISDANRLSPNSFHNQQQDIQAQKSQICTKRTAQSLLSKIVLDKLDGSFKSGELTAILGPSGAGKTTLLDCLTGHRKHGLSGSIRISSSSLASLHNTTNSVSTTSLTSDKVNSSAATCCDSGCIVLEKCPVHKPIIYHQRYSSSGVVGKKSFTKTEHNQQIQCHKNLNLVNTNQQYGIGATNQGDNLKVSIIPQNDHLMGHLTVYETLNYASKMKNCFEKQFDHKLNIKRVAQQLGLMSCLGTRINKLSGGQYKRVSIAQELLSSPDILILDEPTSGLDAMTCYQTVQVLRKLTDDRQVSGQNQIAVILTIHQPNSDVFQQFNHVYVVAQGGKCIYEGPPSNIESVINRIGIRLPNSYYNPATMIVEIAAGKFGSEAIVKLNSIQKKQYDYVVPDEQTSTGDSAVDCPSSSNDDDDDGDHDDDDDDVSGTGDANDQIEQDKGKYVMQQQHNDDNNNDNVRSLPCTKDLKNRIAYNNNSLTGLVNKGFTMETDEDITTYNRINNDNNNNNNNLGVVVVTIGDNNNNNNLACSEDANSIDKIKMMNTIDSGGDNENRRKKRRRTRKRSVEQSQNTNNNNNKCNTTSSKSTSGTDTSSMCDKISSLYGYRGGGGGGGGGGDGNGGGGGVSSREKRLKLNSLKADQKFPFWRHTYLHFHRSWLSIVRDPMLCSMQLALHIIVPVMVSLVYGTNVGKPNACPRAGPMDIMAYALEPTDTALQLQEDLRTTLENIGYIFFKLYGIIFAAMTVTVLTFPLDMHVLVKEFRNGWYGLSSYFLGRTLADIPFQLTLPFLAMSLSYYATGQPYSYFQWRFLSITAILILSSLIAQSQGLLFGAILMDKMKAAVFVAPAATTPIILFAGFLVRTQSIPHYLRPLSNLSYLRYAIEACLISRYGFNQCECDAAMFNQTVPELPPIARSMLDYWLSSFKVSATSETSELTSSNSSSLAETTTLSAVPDKPDLFTKLIDSLGKANSFGRNITSCEQVVPYPMIDYDLKDSQLFNCFAILLFMLVFTRLLTFFIVCFKVKRKV